MNAKEKSTSSYLNDVGDRNSRLISYGIFKEKLFQPHFFITGFGKMEFPPLQRSEEPGVSYHSCAPEEGLRTAKPA